MDHKPKYSLEDMTVSEYLEKWFHTSTLRMEAQGVYLRISFEEFYNHVIQPNQLKTLHKLHEEGKLSARQHEENPYAYVITWKSYAARSTNIYDLDSACFTTRTDSARRSLPKKGDQLRPSHIEAKSKAAKGKPKTKEHADNISKGLKGHEQSAEHKANRSAALKAYWAAKRNAK